jgi:UPF0755 protein
MKKQIIITLIIIALVIIWWQPINFSKVEIMIPKGASAREIVTYLSDSKIVRDTNEFLFWLKISGQEKHLKSGKYELYTYKNPMYVISNLTRGGISDIIVTIPEGLTIYETADILAAHGLITQNLFIQLCTDKNFIQTLGLHVMSLEGYLFPDTYSFSSSQSDTAIIITFITNFNSHIKKFKLSNQDSLNKIITLASLVEKEAKFSDERPIIAQVFIKRLQLHHPLESCATVLYALKYESTDVYRTTNIHKTKLTEHDLKINSAYNTYLHIGLPPGPICSPGENSIEAVISPADVDYLYFVSKGDGHHHFSKTYREHLIAKERYSAKY